MYMTIGNISKSVRRRPSQRAWILVGYIPVPELSCISKDEKKREMRWNVFHTCMAKLMEPLKAVAAEGVEVVCADGGVRRIHPILAAYVGDFPEQCTVACTSASRCPICTTPMGERGDLGEPAHLRTKHELRQAFEHEDRGYSATRIRLGIRPVKPFWLDLPFANGSQCITPDLLHQLHQGVFGVHMIRWCTRLLGKEEIDRRYKGMPPHSGLRYFGDGISKIKKGPGGENKEVGKTFVPIMAGSRPAEVVGAARALMDFLYRAHRPQLHEGDLEALESDLEEFHDYKDIFRSAGLLQTKKLFNGIPKLHMLRHYAQSIRELGTTDGYNTEATERLHIDYVKRAFKASNGVDPTPQMARWLQHGEAMSMLRAQLERHRIIPKRKVRQRRDGPVDDFGGDSDEEGEDEDAEEDEEDVGEDIGGDNGNVRMAAFKSLLEIAKRAPHRNVRGSELVKKHHAHGLFRALRTFILRHSPLHRFAVFDKYSVFNVWTRFRIRHKPLPFAPLIGPKVDRIRASPGSSDEYGRSVRKRAFDTVLLDAFPSLNGIHRKFLAQATSYHCLFIQQATALLAFESSSSSTPTSTISMPAT